MNNSPFITHISLGLGRITDNNVWFFDSPVADEVAFPITDAVSDPIILARQQRVWWHDGSRWLTGFVDSSHDQRGLSYWVNFPNGGLKRVPADALRVRWSVSLEDPVGLLKAGTVESRFLNTARVGFVRSVLGQRAAVDGLAGLWSSAVDFYAHQVGAARRVLSDPVRRYLMADEVGLGKTIEAGMVIRQSLLESVGDILVLTPTSLLEQWQRELSLKFRVEQFGDRVRLAAHDEITALAPSARLLTVVDEAHLLTSSAGGEGQASYEALRALAHSSRGLLLLSATPVRSNEDGFLRMLHLLDPDAYSLDDVEEFRRRVEMRDDLADALATLADDMPLPFLDEPITELRTLLPNEQWLQNELDLLAAEVDRSDESAARVHCRRIRLRLSETHRIHRRMIRTRRGALLAKAFPVRGRTKDDEWLLTDGDTRRAAVLDFLDEVRSEIAGTADIDSSAIFRILLGRATAPTSALADLACALRGDDCHDLDEHERHALRGIAGSAAGFVWADRLSAITDTESLADRLSAMCEWVWRYIGHAQVVVACSYPASAEAAAQRLEARFGPHRVVRLLSGMSRCERAEAVERFTTDPSRTVLVVDRSAEEGVNLQVAEAVLHLDLPISASRVEQRLGRFDRHMAADAIAPKPVHSMAFREADTRLDAQLGAWRTALDQGFDIFRRSSATLQYVLPELETAFLAEALEGGLVSAGRRVAEQRDALDAQRRRIQAQDLLDALDDRADDEELNNRLTAADDADAIRQAFRGYAVEMLGFTETEEGTGVRYGVSTKRPPRLTEPEIRTLGPELLRGRYTHLRPDAGAGLGLLRWGGASLRSARRLCATR